MVSNTKRPFDLSTQEKWPKKIDSKKFSKQNDPRKGVYGFLTVKGNRGTKKTLNL